MSNQLPEKSIVWNYRLMIGNFNLIFAEIFTVFSLIITYEDSEKKENDFGIAITVFIAVLIIALNLLSPVCCIVNADGIKIKYLIGKSPSANWNQIREIKVVYDLGHTKTFITRYNYSFEGVSGRLSHYDEEFMKCKKLEKLLMHYAKDKLDNRKPK